MEKELIEKLTEGYPMDPEDASELIVETLLPDLPKARRDAIREVIRAWSAEREDSVANTTMESSYYY